MYIVAFSLDDDNLTILIEECEKLLDEDSVNQQQNKYNWDKRMTNLNSNWESSRQKIFETLLSCAAVIPSVCSKCFSQETRIYCGECTDSKHLCLSCDEEVHQKFPLHDRDGIYHGYRKALSPRQSLSVDGKLQTFSEYG